MARKKARKSSGFGKLLLVFLVLSLLFAFYAYESVFAKRERNYKLFIKKGDSVSAIANRLESAGVISNQLIFKALIKYTADDTKIAVGIYELKGKLSLYEIVNKITYGSPDMISVTLLDGWNLKQIRAALNKNPMLTHLTESMTNEQIAESMNIDYPKLEGLIYPSTYFVAPYQSDLDVLNMAYSTMQDKLGSIWSNRESGLIYTTPYEMLTMASLVQKEVSESQDMVVVATVFNNRLAINMKLQDDPAVFYGLENKDVITRADFKIDTPYNTYLHSGLPPTPICSPGENALYAAAHPNANKQLLYFIATKEGKTIYTTNYADHSKAVKQYLRKK